ncbi:hypothetical protein KC342_g95 [Hortaea werneckii]|nr:hypothetical protein KC342_g95 [Hortaea werneckii]
MTADLDAQGTVLKNIYAQLELRFNLLREITPKYTSYQFRSLVGSPFDGTPASKAIAGAAICESEWTEIDVEKAAAATVPRNKIVKKLRQWQDSGIIDLQHAGVVNVYRIMRALPTTREEKDQIINDVYADLESREGQDLDRIDDVVSLLTGTKCFARALAEHFGDSLPEGEAECGECTWCETHVPRWMDIPAPRTFNVGLFDRILSIIPDGDDPRYLARVAFGIRSPRVTAARLGRHQVFGSMEDHDFGVSIQLTESPADVPSSAIKQEDDRAERKPRVKREPIVKMEDDETKPGVKQEPTVKTEEAGVKSEPVNDVLVEEMTRRDDRKRIERTIGIWTRHKGIQSGSLPVVGLGDVRLRNQGSSESRHIAMIRPNLCFPAGGFLYQYISICAQLCHEFLDTHLPLEGMSAYCLRLILCGTDDTSAVHFAVASANFSIGLVLPGIVDG